MICYWDVLHDAPPIPRDSDRRAHDFLSDFRCESWNGLEYEAWAWYEKEYKHPLAVGGFIFCGQERADVFLILSKNYKNRALYFHRNVKKILNGFIKKNRVIREMYAYIDAQYPDRSKWVEHFGFKKTNQTIRKYDIDWWVYRWDSSHP